MCGWFVCEPDHRRMLPVSEVRAQAVRPHRASVRAATMRLRRTRDGRTPARSIGPPARRQCEEHHREPDDCGVRSHARHDMPRLRSPRPRKPREEVHEVRPTQDHERRGDRPSRALAGVRTVGETAMRAEQPPLFLVARSDSRFTRETLRRGGPYEVQGKRWRGRKVAVAAHGAATSPESLPQAVLDAMGWKGGKRA